MSATIRRESIAVNYKRVVDQVSEAALRCGRKPENIRIVVVTKTHPLEIVQAVIEAGALDIGENYVEEAIPKIKGTADNRAVRWHMIGHIQSRKAQEVCEHFQFVHSLDSLKLAQRLSRFATYLGRTLPVWMEFNVGGEGTKSGWRIAEKADWPGLIPEIGEILSLSGLEFLGVMTVPPYSINPEDSRPYYRQLCEFRDFIVAQLHIYGFQEFSIGMSSDFEVAIQKGSTCVRIGQAILGARG